MSALDGSTIATVSKRAPTEAALLAALKDTARELAPKLAQRLGRPLTPLPEATAPLAAPAKPFVRYERVNTTMRNVGKWILIGGAAGFVVSAIGFIGSPPLCSPGEGCGLSESEGTWLAVMAASLGVTAVGVLIYAIGGTELKPVQVGLVPVPGGAMVALGAPW